VGEHADLEGRRVVAPEWFLSSCQEAHALSVRVGKRDGHWGGIVFQVGCRLSSFGIWLRVLVKPLQAVLVDADVLGAPDGYGDILGFFMEERKEDKQNLQSTCSTSREPIATYEGIVWVGRGCRNFQG
jgi:hypothetical protein